jgi:hypothetical protein
LDQELRGGQALATLLSGEAGAFFWRMIRVFILLLAGGLSAWRAGAAEPSLKVVLREDGVTCVRAAQITDNFADQLRERLTNTVSGLVLDLRFADGDKAVALNNPLRLHKGPVVLLVNDQTRGAAADLAAQLRTKGRAILIGGTNVSGKLAPDITIAATSEQEKKFQENPYERADKPATLAGNHDLLPFIDHTSEADLVRRRMKDGEDSLANTPRAAPEQPVIRDPALARAVDLFKALAVLNKSHG